MDINRLKQSILIFTDGACKGNPGPGGWGSIIALENARVFEIGGRQAHTTNNQMELTAILEGVRQVLDNPLPIYVMSDSSYALNAINSSLAKWSKNGWRTSLGTPVANITIWQDILGLLEKRRLIGPIYWHHVRGHQGIAGNERADQIATSFAEMRPFNLYDGSLENYGIELFNLSAAKSSNPSIPASGKPWYLSYVDGKLTRHKTWPDCQARVAGKSQAKYRKITSQAMEEEILASWNVGR